MPPSDGYIMYEGIVETDHWFGPLFTNLRLTRTHRPIKLCADWPLAQVQPLPKEAYADTTLASTHTIMNLGGFREQDWSDYYKNLVVPNEDPDRSLGSYAVKARRLAKRRPDEQKSVQS
jgi:hypothetical protein